MAASQPSRFDFTFTKHVLDLIGFKCTSRNRQLLVSFIEHIHDFARENELSVEECRKGIEFVNSIGQSSTTLQNEGQRVSDVIGLDRIVSTLLLALLSERWTRFEAKL
jgi:catechol 1,2-dioxygenase